MTTRYDVSSVPAQGGYVAKRCPVRAQNDVLKPCEPLEASEVLQRLWNRGNEFEADVFEELRRLHAGARVVPDGSVADREAATAGAMADGAELILGGRLPVDQEGHRAGEPDLLIAARGGGYRAVDVKHHKSLVSTGKGLPGHRSALAAPSFEMATDDGSVAAGKEKDDLLQLAHYQRMLEARGSAATGGRFGGIIGKECQVTWYNLDAPLWQAESLPGERLSSMELYDLEFADRLDVICAAMQHLVDDSVELLAAPTWSRECDQCPWSQYCLSLLEAGSGHVSLVPGVGLKQLPKHLARGVGERGELAALDFRTAQLVADGVDVASLIQAAQGQATSLAIANLPPFNRRPKQVANLTAAGVETVADVPSLDAVTAAYSECEMSGLPEQIDQARAALGPAHAYRRRGVGALSAPRGDIEVDVDMENVEDGVYLWGALVTDRCDIGVEQGYRPFATWEPLTPESESALFEEFWKWLTGLRRQVAGVGPSFRAYCYNAPAENGELLRLGEAAGVLDEAEAFIGSDEWVDMLRVVNRQLITGGATGLKAVAPLAGFEWEVENPGGGESMVWHDRAVDAGSEAEREEAKKWLLTYNRGDVEATLALREWLDSDPADIPPIETL